MSETPQSDGPGGTTGLPQSDPVSGDINPCDETLRSYEQAADLYREAESAPHPPHLRFLDRFALAVPRATVLEVGSATGRDARLLEARGLRIVRTDATESFVEMLRAGGERAQRVDVRYDELGGPWDAVFANAVLLHLTRPEFHAVLTRIRRAVAPGGVLAFSVKEGDGEAWSHAKLSLPRHFTYWRETPLRHLLHATGWADVEVEHVAAREPWLYLLCRRPPTDHLAVDT